MSPDQSEWAAWAASVKTIFADVTKNDAFDEVIAAWDEPLCCQTEQSTRPCRNAARWLAIGHGCDRKLLCTLHKRRWIQRALRTIARSPRGMFKCPLCGQTFTTPEQCVTFRPL
jgi:hypothetical protein